MYIYIYIGGLGELVRLVWPPGPGNRFLFRLWLPFVRAWRARRSCVCVCETCLLNAGADLSRVVLLLAAGLWAIVVAIRMGFNYFYMLFVGSSCLFVVERMGFKAWVIELEWQCMGFKEVCFKSLANGNYRNGTRLKPIQISSKYQCGWDNVRPCVWMKQCETM